MVMGQVFKDKHKILECRDIRDVEGLVRWGEEEEKLFVYLRRSCLNSSLVLGVAKRLCELKSFAMKAVLSRVAVAVGSKTSSQSNLHKARLTFIACLLTSFMETPRLPRLLRSVVHRQAGLYGGPC